MVKIIKERIDILYREASTPGISLDAILANNTDLATRQGFQHFLNFPEALLAGIDEQRAALEAIINE